MADNRISEIIQNQLPSFFTEEGSNLPLFLTKYFEFLESYQIEYTDLILDEYNMVLEDDEKAYYIYGTALDDGLIYTSSDEGIEYDVGLQTGYYFPIYGNKKDAIAVSDDPDIVYELHLEEFAGRTFYMPQKGGESGVNFGVFENDPPTTTLTQYDSSGIFVLEDTPEDAIHNNELLVESDRDPTTATFSLGELIVGSVSGVEAIITGVQNHGVYPAGKYLSTDTTSANYKTDPHVLFARPINSKAFRHGETIIGKRSRAKAYVGRTDNDIKRNPLRGAADLDLVNDIDETDNMYLARFRDDFLTNIPMDSIGDIRQAVKTAKEIYRARGTEDSFLWLWRTVYGSEQLSFIYPKERLLRPSDGTWRSLKSIKIFSGSAINADMFNSKVIKGEQSQATATVDNSISYFEGSTGVTELFLTDYVKGYDIRFDAYSDFRADEAVATIEAFADTELMGGKLAGDEVKAMTFPSASAQGTCIAVIGEIDIISNGTGYDINDQLVLTGGAGQGAIARVATTANGAIDEIIIDDGGNGYIGGETLAINNAGTLGTGHTGAISKVLPTGLYRSSNTLVSAAISTADGGTATNGILLNSASFSIEQEGVKYPENINTHFSSSNTVTFVAQVANQDTADGGANILLEEGTGTILIDSTDGSADAGDNILCHTKAFEDDIQPGYYVYDSKTGTKGTIAGPSVNNSTFIYAIESPTEPNFVEGSACDLYYSANGSIVPGKTNMFTISTIQPTGYYEIKDDEGVYTNQLGDGSKSVSDYYGGTVYTYTGFGSISETQVITTGIDYIRAPKYEAKNESTLGLEQWRFEDPITGKNTGRLSFLNFAENIYGRYRYGESIIGVTSGTKAKVILPVVNSTSNSTFSTMKVLPEETTFSLEDENVLLGNIGDFENGSISGLSAFTSKRTAVDTGSHTLSVESSNTISGSHSGKIAVNDQLDTYIGLRSIDSEVDQAYENLIIPGNQYNAKISFRGSISLRFIELRYGHSDTDADYEPSGPAVGLTEAVVYTHGETTNADQIYTFEGKFVASSDRYHAVYLFANTATSTSYDLHIDNISISDISSRGKIQYEGFNTADTIDSFMMLEPGDFTPGEVIVSTKGARTSTLATSNTVTLEKNSGYGNNAILKAGALKTGSIKSLAISSAGINYNITPDVTAPSGDGNATFLAKRTSITNYPGKFTDKLGMVSDIIRIQDSYYYQDFSYVLRSDIQINEFRDLVRSFVHPAGWNVFGEIGILLLLNVNVDVETDTTKKIEIFVDRTPSFVPTYGPITSIMRGRADGVPVIHNSTSMEPYTSIYGQINFLTPYIHKMHVEFLDPRCIGFGITTDDINFAFHGGRVDWLVGQGWDYEPYNRGLAGQFDPSNDLYDSNRTGRVEIPHHFAHHDKALLNSSVKIVPWYPNVYLELIVPGHYEGYSCSGHTSWDHFFEPQHTTNEWGATAGAQRPGNWGTLGGLDGNPNLERKGGIEYWPEIGILGKYRSPDGVHTMPLIEAYWTYGEEEIEIFAPHTLGVESFFEIFDRWGLQRIQLDLPTLSGITTYVGSKVADLEPTLELGLHWGMVAKPNATAWSQDNPEIVVTVVNTDFYFDGININDYDVFINSNWARKLIKGVTYRFNLSDSSNTNHLLKFASVLDGDHNAGWVSGMEYSSTAVGTPGTGGAYVDFKVPDHTYKSLRFDSPGAGADWKDDYTRVNHFAYCDTHSDMGGPIQTEHKSVLSSWWQINLPPALLTLPALTTDSTYGHEEIIKVIERTFSVESEYEIFDRWGLQRIKLDLPALTGIPTYVNMPVVNREVEIHSPIAGIPDPLASTAYWGLAHMPGQSYARPKDKKLRNPATFIVAGAKVYGGMAVGLRPDGKVERVYQTGNVCFPRINYVHSLLGIVNETAEVGEAVTIRATDSVEERVYDLIPGAEYYPNYAPTMIKGSDHERWITTTPPTITAADELDRIKLGKAATKDKLDLSFPTWKMYEYRAHEDISKGQVVGLMSNGKIQLVFCEADGTAKPQLDGVHSLLGLAKTDILEGDYGEVVTVDKRLIMEDFPTGAYNPLASGLSEDTSYYVDYRDATIKEFGTYSNHPDNIIGVGVMVDEILITAKLPNHQTYSPQWDLANIEYPYPTYCPVRTSPNPDEYFSAHETYDAAAQYDGQVINSLVISNVTPVKNIEQGSTVYFDDINIILEESDGFLLEDGDDLLAEDGTSAADSAIGKIIIESEFLLYEDHINTGIGHKINIYSRHDAKYIVGDFTTETFNIHNRGNKYFPEGISDAVAQQIVLE